MKTFFVNLKNLIDTTRKDHRIPERDKKLLSVLLLVLGIRIFFIPDWIPYVGFIDILFLLGVILDYFFGVLDQNLLLSHYPWGMKSFARLKRLANFFSLFAPPFIKDNIWQYTKDPF